MPGRRPGSLCRACHRRHLGRQRGGGRRQSAASQSASRSITRCRICGDGAISGLGGCKIASLPGPGQARERLAEVAVVGILGRDHQALPVGKSLGERAVPGSQVLDPLTHLGGLLARGQGELVTLSAGRGLGFGRT